MSLVVYRDEQGDDYPWKKENLRNNWGIWIEMSDTKLRFMFEYVTDGG